MGRRNASNLKTLAQSVVDAKFEYDRVERAISLARQGGHSDTEDGLIKLNASKRVALESLKEASSDLLGAMPLSQNTVQLYRNWYGVRCIDNTGEQTLHVNPLMDTDLFLFKRDGRTERELTPSDYANLTPASIDWSQRDYYDKSIHDKALLLVEDLFGELSISPTEEDKSEEVRSLVVSYHACERYVERKLGIKGERQVREYLSENISEVSASVLIDFHVSEKVWVDRDGIEYYFNEDNIMFVVGTGKVITLYEKDYGFTRPINRMITLEQLKVLAETDKELREFEESKDAEMSLLEGQSGSIDLQVEEVMAKLEALKAEKDLIKAKVTRLNAESKSLNSKYNVEYDKLFKEWKGVNHEQK